MDETLKIYSPKQNLLPIYSREEIPSNEKKPSPRCRPPKSKWESRLDSLREVLAEHKEKEDKLSYKHAWVPIFINWVVFALLIMLFTSLIIWGIQVRNENKETYIRQTAYAEFQAEKEQAEAELAAAKAKAEAEEKASEEYIIGQMASALSKMYYGIKNFEEKYHYSELDFETYGRCAYNRLLNGKYSDKNLTDAENFAKIVFQKEQFLSCFENNPDVEPYHSMAKKHIEKWRSEAVAPISSDYEYAELTSNGVYLKNQFNADGYARRWRATN